MNAKNIRKRAREIFKPYYVYGVAVILLHMAVYAFQSFLSFSGALILNATGNEKLLQLLMTLSFVVFLFVALPMGVGVKKFFLELSRNQAELKDIIAPFKNGYDRSVGIMFMAAFKTVLWSVLFIVPGIYKSYEYAMIPFILADNPTIENKKAFELSKKYMKGNKLRLFRLQISFIGWFLLASIPMGMGMVFLMPYTNTAYAVFYEEIRNNLRN